MNGLDYVGATIAESRPAGRTLSSPVRGGMMAPVPAGKMPVAPGMMSPIPQRTAMPMLRANARLPKEESASPESPVIESPPLADAMIESPVPSGDEDQIDETDGDDCYEDPFEEVEFDDSVWVPDYDSQFLADEYAANVLGSDGLDAASLVNAFLSSAPRKDPAIEQAQNAEAQRIAAEATRSKAERDKKIAYAAAGVAALLAVIFLTVRR